ncbi:uncharacterized protein LOC128270155 [Anopheles cruzii]|uniref:uncharacterized protein LOC128270155 n=1 Tax=Anopheles cruzii TaxID=68878 RepID=UPI0022EC78D3|nr:uncharacterized protein LOC128270155 [Anopheles cruzii]
MHNSPQNHNGEEPLEEQAHRVICSLPISPLVFGGTYNVNDDYSTDSPTSMVSELSFSSDTSEGTVYEEVHTNAVPIVEFPSEEDAPRKRLSSQDQVITPQMIGAALKKSGTVLMQRSRDNRLERQLEEMRDLMRNEDELVVLKEPSVRQMASQPAFPRDAMEEFLEHSETMFNLVHDANTQMAGRADISERISRHSSEEVFQTEALPVDNRISKEFVGCFSRNDDTVLYKRTISIAQAAQPAHDPARQSLENIDTVIAQHAQCLHEAETVTEPSVQIYQRNNDDLLALLTFSKESSAVLKTSNAMLKEAPTAELDKTIRQTYRKTVANPDEMISMQTEVASSSDYQAMKETSPQRLGGDLQQTFPTLPSRSSFGLTNESNNLSGGLEKQQAEVYTTVSGSISDQHGNLAVRFEAQVYDLGSLENDEPIEECVIRVERLSDEFDHLSEMLTFQVVCDEAENASEAFVVATVIEELITDERIRPSEHGTIVLSENILGRLSRYLKELLEPAAIMLHNIYKKLEGIEFLRSDLTKAVSETHFSSSSQKGGVVESRTDGGSKLLQNDSQSRSFTNFCALENLQEIRSIFGEANDHLTIIQSDLSAIKTKINLLIEEQHEKTKPPAPSADIQHALKRPSNLEIQQLGKRNDKVVPHDKVVPQKVCLALLANHFQSNGLFCPVEIYSCHAVSPEVMVVHWTVDQDLLSCIVGFEIFVDGVLSSVCFSNRRRTALVGNIDLQKQHHITLHATPDPLTREAKVEWAPAFFLYHLLDEPVH